MKLFKTGTISCIRNKIKSNTQHILKEDINYEFIKQRDISS
jgi:hypothetical protein